MTKKLVQYINFKLKRNFKKTESIEVRKVLNSIPFVYVLTLEHTGTVHEEECLE